MEYIKERIEQNIDKMKGRNIAIYPFGNEGKKAEYLIQNCVLEKVTYKIDNYSQDPTIISFDDFIQLKDNNVYFILSTVRVQYLRFLLGQLLSAGFSIQRILILHKEKMLSIKAMEKVLSYKKALTILDIGCGQGIQGRIFEDYGKNVVGLTMSHNEGYDGNLLSKVIYTDFFEYSAQEKYDVVWVSHILEHVTDVQAFLEKIKNHIKTGGVLAISVPAREKNILLTHIHSFNAGRLLRYLLCAGIDCTNAEILEYGYNLSIVIPNVRFIEEDFDTKGMEQQSAEFEEADKIFKYLPPNVVIQKTWNNVYTFDGDISELNWNTVDEAYIL